VQHIINMGKPNHRGYRAASFLLKIHVYYFFSVNPFIIELQDIFHKVLHIKVPSPFKGRRSDLSRT